MDNQPAHSVTPDWKINLELSIGDGLCVSKAQEVYYALSAHKSAALKELVSSLVYELTHPEVDDNFTDSSYAWHTYSLIEDIQDRMVEKIIDLADRNYEATREPETQVDVRPLQEKAAILADRFVEYFELKKQQQRAGGRGHE